MKSLKVAIVLTLLTAALLITLATAQPKNNNDKKNPKKGKEAIRSTITDSYQGSSRFFNSKKKPHYVNPYKSTGGHNAGRGRVTCDSFPRICRVKGSSGPDCCGKRCVNVKTDKLNCGMCGRKCAFPEVCCNGRCVNLWYDRRNCGGCQNKCIRGNFCYRGMCNYS
ncbi:stigma-specific STIG1-like protein 1 [Spinacia oleracea]|uniref:Stigma-specific STIG1-like protein 1 n=1 Tax=Spinacia oleracea TaxID=3562 RepID=A0A9R0JK34_SPIOL|nr:stigma-specific STIG1-like protein 1 [Spinacia oleracea]